MQIKPINLIEVSDWNKLVSDTYKRPYSFQQQDGCKSRGIVTFTVPCDTANDDEMNEDIPEKVNGEIMGVKFKTWLERDPKKPIANQKYDYQLSLFWERNFYPDFGMVVNDLHNKGLLEKGKYSINIDW